jgi:hypothetical protein
MMLNGLGHNPFWLLRRLVWFGSKH